MAKRIFFLDHKNYKLHLPLSGKIDDLPDPIEVFNNKNITSEDYEL
jgi:hypothetical protein